MKPIYFLVFLCISLSVYSSSEPTQTDIANLSSLVRQVQAFLNQFQVERHYKEPKSDFLKRLVDSKKFIDVSYAICPSIIRQDNKIIKIDRSKKQHLLGLFIDDTYVVKPCGFWQGREEGFYVSPVTTIVGKGLARFKEKGNYEWIINFPDANPEAKFANSSIQSLIDSLIKQSEITVKVPLENGVSVAFTKNATTITASLQYT